MASLTVGQLIEKLKKMPKNAKVYWQDHDHSDYEWNSAVYNVAEVDYDNYESDVKEGKAWPVDSNFKLKGKVVMIRP